MFWTEIGMEFLRRRFPGERGEAAAMFLAAGVPFRFVYLAAARDISPLDQFVERATKSFGEIAELTRMAGLTMQEAERMAGGLAVALKEGKTCES